MIITLTDIIYNFANLIGAIGAVLILAAWISETIHQTKIHRLEVNNKFIAIYLSGSALLAFYSFLKNDAVFIILNILIFSIVFFELMYGLFFYYKKKK